MCISCVCIDVDYELTAIEAMAFAAATKRAAVAAFM